MVVQPDERNTVDQQALAAELWETHRVKVEYVTLHCIAATGTVDDGGRLSVVVAAGEPPVEASVVYFRAGYVSDPPCALSRVPCA